MLTLSFQIPLLLGCLCQAEHVETHGLIIQFKNEAFS